MNGMASRHTLSIFAWLMGVVLAGCGLSSEQRTAISGFSGAASQFGDMTSRQLIDARNTIIDLNMRTLALNPGRLEHPELIDDGLTPDRLAVRLNAAATIKTYAELLTAIVEDTQKKELTQAADKLKAAVRGYDKDKSLIDDGQLSAIGQGIEAIGGMVVEKRRADELRKILPTIDPIIQKIGSLFSEEFGTKGAISVEVDGRAQLALEAADKVLDAKYCIS